MNSGKRGERKEKRMEGSATEKVLFFFFVDRILTLNWTHSRTRTTARVRERKKGEKAKQRENSCAHAFPILYISYLDFFPFPFFETGFPYI